MQYYLAIIAGLRPNLIVSHRPLDLAIINIANKQWLHLLQSLSYLQRALFAYLLALYQMARNFAAHKYKSRF